MIDTSAFLSGPCKYADDVPVLGRAQVEAVSQEILSAYMPQALSRQAPVDVEYLMEHIFGLRLELQTLQPDSSILGETIFSDGYRAVYDLNNKKAYIAVTSGTVLLDASMCEKMEIRTAFTEAHELGHWILHKRFYSATDSRACRSRRSQRMYFPHDQAKTAIDWTEWQANAFAAAILLPRPALRVSLREFLRENATTWDNLKQYARYENRVKYVAFLERVSKTFGVSRETARLRMNKLCNLHFPR